MVIGNKALFIYFDDESRFKLLIQATELDGNFSSHESSIEGQGEIITDNIDAERC